MSSKKHYLVSLTDVTPNRATVADVSAYADADAALDAACTVANYALMTDGLLAPVVGERVWIELTGRSRGRRTITARQ